MFSFFFKSKKRRKLEKEGLASSKQRLKPEQTLGHAINKSKLVSLIILAVAWLFCVLVLIIPTDTGSCEFYLVIDQQAPKTIYADFNFLYLSKLGSEKRREERIAAVPLLYEIDTAACKASISKAQQRLKEISTISKASNKDTAKILDLPPSFIHLLLTIANDPKKLNFFTEKLSSTLYKGIIASDVLKDKNQNTKICIIDSSNDYVRTPQSLFSIATPIAAAINFSNEVASDYSPQNRKLLRKVLYDFSQQFLSPNLSYNKEWTDIELKNTIDSVENNVFKLINRRGIVIKKGEKVTPSILEKFKAYEIEKNKRKIHKNYWENLSYDIIISFILFIITGMYLYNLHPKILQSNQKMATIAIVVILSVLCIVFADILFNLLAAEYNLPVNLKTCLIPLGLTSILLSVLIGLRAATFASLLVCLIAAIKLDSYFVVILGMGVSCISAYAVYKSKNYKEYFIKALLSVSITFIALEFLGQLKFIVQNPNLIFIIIGLSFLIGLVTAVIALTILFPLESIFKVNTDMSLLSLCDYNHPLLKRLQLEAPGTFHHCLVVATLAEQAASVMGANPIKARVCALFHDIGKLSKPGYFSENNIGSENQHFELRPGMSCMIIINHVKEGVNLAIKHKLCQLIRDVIQQHHGTSLVYYFYRRASEENDNKTKEIAENKFRYPGPKPHEKEIVLVSLADSCEAASRSIVKPTPSKIEALIWEIIRKKIRDGELDNADFTFKELALAKKSFAKTLSSMLHTRINYPAEEEDKNEGDLFYAAKKNAKNSGKKIPNTDEKDSGNS